MIDSQSNACHRLLHTVMMCQYVEERGNKRQKSHVAHGQRSGFLPSLVPSLLTPVSLRGMRRVRRLGTTLASFHDGNGVRIMRIASLLLIGQPLSNSCTPYVLVYVVATNHRFHYQNANVHVCERTCTSNQVGVVTWRARSRKIFSRKMTLCKFAKILLHKNIHVYGMS